MEEIRGWIEAEGTGHWFFVAFPVVLICLLIWFKGGRVRFLIPSLLISIIIINPWFYKKWDELGLYAYWRIIWVIPVIPVVASLVPSISERIEKIQLKCIAAAVGVGVVIASGTFLYSGVGGSFVKATNAVKLPDYVVAIADRMLELDDHPRIVAQDPISVYIRQYSAQITTLYGRDIHGHILWPDYLAKKVNNCMNEPNSKSAETIEDIMLENDYSYLIVDKNSAFVENCIDDHFILVDNIGTRGIYKPSGALRKRITRDEIGQIKTVTYLNENGDSIDYPYGYATVERSYDPFGNIICEKYFDSNGVLTRSVLGYSEIHREYDKQRRIVKEEYLDEEGKPYYRKAGNAGIFQSFDDNNKEVTRYYLGGYGEILNRVDGYSEAKWTWNNKYTTVSFYNLSGKEIDVQGINLAKDIPENWSAWMTPQRDGENVTFNVGSFNLGPRAVGDQYTCQIEIEFSGVVATENREFRFWTQGEQDGAWTAGSIWSPGLVYFSKAPEDGIYHFKHTVEITENMVNSSNFEIAFRCDNWSAGSFRVRNIKIEKGNESTDWTPGI